MAKQEYNASTIKALSQHTHLLKRLNLTFGHETGGPDNPFSSQKTVAIREITDNAVDEIRDGHGSRVRVHFYADGSVEVQDNGRGLPIDIGQDADGSPANGIYLCLGVIQSGGKFTTDSTRKSAGLNGVGASSACHLSKRTDVSVYRGGKEYKLSFQDGAPGFFDAENNPKAKFTPAKNNTILQEVKDSRPASEKKEWKTGTKVRLWLRGSVFSSKYPIDIDDLIDRLRGTSFLEKRLTVDVTNDLRMVEDQSGKESSQHEIFHSDDGIMELVKLNQTKPAIAEAIYIEAEGTYIEQGVAVLTPDGKVRNEDVKRTVPISVAFSWDNGYDYSVESYVNTVRTRLGGYHEWALERAMLTVFNDRFESMRGLLPKGMDKPIIEDYKEGLTAVISVDISEPQFTGQAKEELGGRDVRTAMLKALTAEFEKFANAPKNYELMKNIGTKVCTAARVRQEQREARDLKRQKNAIESSNELPIKLLDCNITHDENSEFYIVEGDSAAGALKGARFSEFQALLPIRGKIINAHKQTPAQVLANEEVKAIIQCLGAGSGNDFDIEKARYGRIFIAADADPDGGSIAALLLVLLWHIAKPMVTEGRLYQVVTPLFAIKTKGPNAKHYYAQDEHERDKIVSKLEKEGRRYDISRIKGLGECPKQILVETGMDPTTRIVKQIVVGDIVEAERMLDIALAPDPAPRKEWIEANPYDPELEGMD